MTLKNFKSKSNRHLVVAYNNTIITGFHSIHFIIAKKRGPWKLLDFFFFITSILQSLLTVVTRLYCRPVSGASMNPARSLGPALIVHVYKGLWVYIIGPPIGTIFGALAYHIIRFTDKPLREITKSSSFLKSMSRE